jgi:hypothetical protein
VSLLLGAVYTGYGVITIIDMRRGWATRGFSHFGAAWIAMAFTCGPHHLEHGLHLALAGRPPGWVELATVIAGLPFGAVWFLLRVEALTGGRGDRFISGTPRWLDLFPTVAVAYLAAFLGMWVALAVPRGSFRPAMASNILLVVLYMMIGWYLLRTQLQNREPRGGWSVSGVSLTAVFPTCAVMHAAWLLYAVRGVYDVDAHGLVIDWLSVPASLYFLWVVRSLYLGAVTDWNQDTASMAIPERADPAVAA